MRHRPPPPQQLANGSAVGHQAAPLNRKRDRVLAGKAAHSQKQQ